MTPDFHDSSMKLWFDFPRVVKDMLRGFMPPNLAGAFDFESLEQLSAQYVDDDMRQNRGDMVWRIRFRYGESEEWLYLLLLLEFQSTVDRNMALRVHAYTARMYTKMLRGKMPEDGKLPPVLPIVIYNGRTPWSAPMDIEEMISVTGSDLAPFQPRQRFFLVDVHRLKVEDLPPNNVLSARIRLEQGTAANPVLEEMDDALDREAESNLRRAIAEYVRVLVERSRHISPDVAARLKMLEETGDLKAMRSLLAERIDAVVDESHARGLATGLEQQREMLLRLTLRKFDAETTARLKTFLASIDDPERLAEIGDHVIDSSDGDELLFRARGSAERH